MSWNWNLTSVHGSEELKQKWLPLVASGRNKLAALALTEPGAGSDLQGGIVTRAVKDGDEWVWRGWGLQRCG